MKLKIFIMLLSCNFLSVHYIFGQKLDRNIYLNLVAADSSEFIKYAHTVNYTTNYDSASGALFAKTKGFVFTKPLVDTGNAFYVLTLGVSTLDKANNKIIFQDAKPVEGKKNTWSDNKYLYFEWDTENPYSKEMWYKVLIYRIK